jgi:hypothetical protein
MNTALDIHPSCWRRLAEWHPPYAKPARSNGRQRIDELPDPFSELPDSLNTPPNPFNQIRTSGNTAPTPGDNHPAPNNTAPTPGDS